MTDTFDVCVVGGGAAGLHTALTAAEAGASVALVSRKPLAESSSYWAQGGLAAALGDDDSPELHAEDTLRAGRGACRRSAVEVLVAESPGAVRELEARGVEFDHEEGELALGLEGGHSRRRIVHAGGASTGRRITERLTELVAGERRIEVLEGCSALALWSEGERCAGVITDRGPLGSPATILATGGAAALWRRTTNPWGAIGAGSVLAHAAGAVLADLELCQFHPTALALPGDDQHDGTLVTEAVRGEGAKLLDTAGRRFTDELAPRDVVTTAILDRMEADGADHVSLDLRGIDPERFPSIFELLRAAGLEPTADLVPVAPAAHYVMGGIATDLEGRASLPGLLAVGECACTGLHGANRLASNSLSECFVLGSRAARAALDMAHAGAPAEPGWRFTPPTPETRDALWRYAGPRRKASELERLHDDPYPLARMIGAAALERRETRGAHLRADFPRPDSGFDGAHIIHPPDGPPRIEVWE
ncbi:MAG: L-aspartate oxidase [Solirubrobacterales bacterium]